MRLTNQRKQPKRSARRDNLKGYFFEEEVEGSSKVSSIFVTFPQLESVKCAFHDHFLLLPIITDPTICCKGRGGNYKFPQCSGRPVESASLGECEIIVPCPSNPDLKFLN